MCPDHPLLIHSLTLHSPSPALLAPCDPVCCQSRPQSQPQAEGPLTHRLPCVTSHSVPGREFSSPIFAPRPIHLVEVSGVALHFPSLPALTPLQSYCHPHCTSQVWSLHGHCMAGAPHILNENNTPYPAPRALTLTMRHAAWAHLPHGGETQVFW